MAESERRTVLVLTYEYPPSAGGGVQRVAKLTRYLPEYGIDPLVLAAEPIPGRPLDERLAEEVAHVPVTRLPARHVAHAIARVLGGPKRLLRPGAPGASASQPAASQPAAGPRVPLSTRLARWISLDDASRWSKAVVRVGADLVRDRDCAAVLASGPPFSVLGAGAWIASTTGVPLVADMRDPWLDNSSAHWPTRSHRQWAEALAYTVMTTASMVTAVSPPIAEEALFLGAARVVTIPNGYDEDDMPARSAPDPREPLRLVFMGRFYALTDPGPFLEALARAGRERREAADVSLDIVGPDNARVRALVRNLGIEDRVRFLGYMPHEEALRTVAAADAGVVLVGDAPGARAVYTGKLFEYLGMRLPVLAMVPPDGAAAELLGRARAGWVVPSGDVGAAVDTIARMAREKRAGGLGITMDDEVVEGLERRHQAGIFAEVLRGVMGE